MIHRGSTNQEDLDDAIATINFALGQDKEQKKQMMHS